MMGLRHSWRNNHQLKEGAWRPRELGRGLAAAGQVFVDDSFRGDLAATAAHADRQTGLDVAQRRGTTIYRFMYLAVSDRAADAYVHRRSECPKPVIGL
jgi:hypothetical protein